MKDSKKIRNTIRGMYVPSYEAIKFQRTLNAVNKAFILKQEHRACTSWDFLAAQLRFISMKTWISQGILMLTFLFILNLSVNQKEILDYSIFYSVFAPVLVISALPEIWKSIRYHSLEIEKSSYYDIRKILMTRLLILGMTDLAAATVMIGITSYNSGMSPYRLILYFLVPFNSTCCICFSAMHGIKRINADFYCSVICTLWAMVLCGLSKFRNIYNTVQTDIWIILIILSIIYMAFILYSILKNAHTFDKFLNFENEGV